MQVVTSIGLEKVKRLICLVCPGAGQGQLPCGFFHLAGLYEGVPRAEALLSVVTKMLNACVRKFSHAVADLYQRTIIQSLHAQILSVF